MGRKGIVLSVALTGLGLAAFHFTTHKPTDKFSIQNLYQSIRDNSSETAFEAFKKRQYKGEFSLAEQPTISQLTHKFLNSQTDFRQRTVAEMITNMHDGRILLDYISPDKLSPCDRIEYYQFRSVIEDGLTLYQDKDPDETAAIIFVNDRQNMESRATRLLGRKITYDELESLAQTELETIDEAYQRLKQSTGVADLNDFAAAPEYFFDTPSDVKISFENTLDHARTSTEHHFYDYDISVSKTVVKEGCHGWNAYASYGRNSVVLYLCNQSYDSKRNMFLASHEYFPGHHLQYSLYNKDRLCPGRRRPHLALSEGWANYGEYLSADRVFQDPAQKLGWLDYRRIRALRVFIDIRRVRDGWDEARLKTFWIKNMPERLQENFAIEYERISKSPNFQHLTYMLGRMAILNVRKKLEAEWGDKFDEKAFHDVLLRAPVSSPKYLYEQVKAAMEIDTALASTSETAN